MKLKGYKTFLLGLLVALLPLLNYINDSQVITKILTNPDWVDLLSYFVC